MGSFSMIRRQFVKYEFVKYEDEKALERVTILVDISGEIPEPQENWAVGSVCIIADDTANSVEYKILNNKRKWVG